ncbi:FAD-binding oxidoreductase [Xanthobacter dioxanivorans]|uniref:FAD-binding oxidoreductase n=1 Tax=Xanthobacter dioxanivorans TaxID=2528964 RepID=A0A974PR27_9HYPH|nr:FAD-binding oxidoreductase [Xanthobacter dioxanivorans]QRG07966.1 FAD-binding oxidoreductase [Xanthobacter dioxanivorans]
MTSFQEIEIAIVGGGIVGLSVARTLQRLGISVICFEAATAGSGQSAGGSRIMRAAYSDPAMLWLAQKARKGWDQWEAEAGLDFIDRTGSFLIVENAEAERARLEGLKLKVRFVSEEEQRVLLPVREPWRAPVILEEEAGTIRAQASIAWLKSSLGAALLEHTPVLGLSQRARHVLVATRTAIFRARRVLVVAGMQTPVLGRAMGVSVPQVYSVHQRLLFPLKPGYRDRPMVSFRDKGDHRHGVLYTYGLPALHDDLFAVGLEPSDTDRTGGGDPDMVVEHTLALVEELLPGLETGGFRIESCVSTSLEHPQDGAPWESERLEVVRRGAVDFFAGGHLFKFAPALGEMLAGMVLGGDVPAMFQPE